MEWSSPVARQAHNLKVGGSNPSSATKNQRGKGEWLQSAVAPLSAPKLPQRRYGSVMPEIICLAERKRARRIFNNTQIIEKVVDGKIVECVDLDAMTPSQRAAYFAAAEREK